MQPQEFEDRVTLAAKARKVFIPHITDNISIAFSMYQEILGTTNVPDTITAKRRTKPGAKYTGQKMDLKIVDIKCPKCDGTMYKQNICRGCNEGRKGFKIRLICEEDPDHEVLL